MWCTDLKRPTARKPHRCDSCGEMIDPGTEYVKWCRFDDCATTSKMHPECYAMHEADAEGSEWEYLQYEHERPPERYPA